MTLVRYKAFEPQKLEDERALDNTLTISLYLNSDETSQLFRAKKLLREDKDSTAVKTLFKLAINLIEQPQYAPIIAHFHTKLRAAKRQNK